MNRSARFADLMRTEGSAGPEHGRPSARGRGPDPSRHHAFGRGVLPASGLAFDLEGERDEHAGGVVAVGPGARGADPPVSARPFFPMIHPHERGGARLIDSSRHSQRQAMRPRAALCIRSLSPRRRYPTTYLRTTRSLHRAILCPYSNAVRGDDAIDSRRRTVGRLFARSRIRQQGAGVVSIVVERQGPILRLCDGAETGGFAEIEDDRTARVARDRRIGDAGGA